MGTRYLEIIDTISREYNHVIEKLRISKKAYIFCWSIILYLNTNWEYWLFLVHHPRFPVVLFFCINQYPYYLNSKTKDIQNLTTTQQQS
jgi:hypothetical protein